MPLFSLTKILSLILVLCSLLNANDQKQEVSALYIPLADHYAAIVAYERYANKMKYADFKIKKMRNWDLLRAYFQSEAVDMAYVMTPLAIDMFNEKPHFHWIGLMHRDGNAFAVNKILEKELSIASEQKDRKPSRGLATALKQASSLGEEPVQVGVPHLLSTHNVILYRFLKEHKTTFSPTPNFNSEVLSITVPPSKSPAFLKKKYRRSLPAALEQSLPWSDIVERENFGKIAWFSKDVMPWKHGHVECIALATDKAIASKFKALKEVIFYIQKAGEDIEKARREGGKALDEIIEIIRRDVPEHSPDAIKASLAIELKVINYEHLNIDKAGLKQIMDYAIEAKILRHGLNIDSFADERFNINKQELEHVQ